MTCRKHAHSWKITSYAPIEEHHIEMVGRRVQQMNVGVTCKKCGIELSGKLSGWLL